METVTTSKQFALNLQDIGKSLIVAALTPVLPIIQMSLAAHQFTMDWTVIGTTAVGGMVAYLIKNFFTPSQTVIVPPLNTPAK